MFKPTLFFVCLLLGFVQCTSAHSSYGRCSQVFCLSDDVDGEVTSPQLKVIEGRTGKAGPPGDRGGRGEPGVVNYTAIDEKIMAKFKEIEERIDAKTEDLIEIETRMNESLKRFEKSLNDSKAEMDEKLKKKKNEIQINTTCDTLCDEITSGIRTNQPVGFATIGAVGKICPDSFKCGIEVYCDCSTGSGGAWTVFQRRMDGSVDFFRNWVDYVHGFGSKTGEFWLGLNAISKLASNSNEYELRIDLESWEDEKAYAQYSTFSVGPVGLNYKLTVAGFTGNSSDSLVSNHNGMPFSAKDNDNEEYSGNCALSYHGAWWFSSGCMTTHLNGKYYQRGEQPSSWLGIVWRGWKGSGYSLKSSEMKFRRISN